jgi:RNA polymerase sigma-70 factor (ECF subfamily)
LWRNYRGAGTLNLVSVAVDPEADPDVELMLAVQRDDASAFERLFAKHIGAVVGFATRFVGTRARAEELAQDVFLQVYKHRGRYQPQARFSTWLYRMVTNACLSEVRRADYRGHMQSRDQAVGDGDDPPQLADTAEGNSEDHAASREMLQRMRMALDELPPQQRAALLLARVEGFSYDEVSASLSCSVSAVKSLIHRATVTLRERLKEDGV